ncbi:MAG: hypothetical protein ACRDTF_14135, partial [Pseudonocardiaceae bacterium]
VLLYPTSPRCQKTAPLDEFTRLLGHTIYHAPPNETRGLITSFFSDSKVSLICVENFLSST